MTLPRWLLPLFLLTAAVLACSDEAAGPDGNDNGTGNDNPSPTPIVKVDDETAAAVAALFADVVGDDTPGGAMGVYHEGTLVFSAGYGLANLDSGATITPRNIFHLGSVGKQFTALGIMMLQEEGQLEYDTPIGEYLPELEWAGEGVTIRRILHHTSGLPDYDAEEDEELYNRLLETAAQPTNEDLLKALDGYDQLSNDPGEEFSYNNTGYDVLGALIERLSGQKYADFMQKRVFGPLGMKDTFALPNPQRLEGDRVCISYDENQTPHEYTEIDNLNGSGSIYSTVGDLFLYDQALYTDKLVSQDTLAEAFTSGELNNGESIKYGFAWDVDEYNGEPYVGHSGAWLNFTSYFLRFPDRQLSVVILLNRDDVDIETLVFQVADLWLEKGQ